VTAGHAEGLVPPNVPGSVVPVVRGTNFRRFPGGRCRPLRLAEAVPEVLTTLTLPLPPGSWRGGYRARAALVTEGARTRRRRALLRLQPRSFGREGTGPVRLMTSDLHE
jgi:hypothetical protein